MLGFTTFAGKHDLQVTIDGFDLVSRACPKHAQFKTNLRDILAFDQDLAAIRASTQARQS